jgi:hypothetical protein
MKPRKNYEEEALRLSKVIDIAIETFEMHDGKDHAWFIKVYSEWKEMLFNSDRKYKTMASLKYDIENVFTMFQEGTGKEVEYFWEQIQKQKLDYIREDKLAKILHRGKIRGRIEYEYATDIVVVATQEKRITEEQATQLKAMIGDFEIKKR